MFLKYLCYSPCKWVPSCLIVMFRSSVVSSVSAHTSQRTKSASVVILDDELYVPCQLVPHTQVSPL